MLKMFICAVLALVTCTIAQPQLNYYLPDNVTYNPKMTTPKQYFGFEIGEWHLHPEQSLHYFKQLAEESDRLEMITMGRSHEQRPTVLLIITSPENHADLESIKAQRRTFLNPKTTKQVNIEDLPGVTWLGYSIHGNEPSGHNTAALIAYYLTAAQSPGITHLLENTIILVEPFINPDGLNRFATWVNMHKSTHPVADPLHREHTEYWPSGRTNHYWFDLNRDWMPAQHPETQARLVQLYQWLPGVLTDHHEMGTNATYFFQPGEPSRTNPLIPKRTTELTQKIARYHEAALDSLGSLYFSEEFFDDFYIGKGSSFTDIIGITGILFEQASARGHIQESDNGLLSFPFAIKNQFATSLSTLQAALDLRKEIHQHQRLFFNEALDLAKRRPFLAYVSGSADEKRNHELKKLLHRHQIDVFELSQDLTIAGYTYRKNRDFVIPIHQPQYRFIQSLFEQRTVFSDSIFYDVSAWNLAHAFNMSLNKISSKRQLEDIQGRLYDGAPLPPGKIISDSEEFAWLLPWNSYNSTAALNQLLQNNLRCKVAQRPFEIRIAGSTKQFDRGTVMIPVTGQILDKRQIRALITQLSQQYHIDFFGASGAAVQSGIDLGSFYFAPLNQITPALITGAGISTYEAGEVWHLLDHRLGINLTLIDITKFNRADLRRYSTLIMVQGSYSHIDSAGIANLKNWLDRGGTLIATRTANKWLNKVKLAKIDLKEIKKVNQDTVTVRRNYGDAYEYRGAQAIGGSIFNANLDVTHPVGYGFERKEIPVFKSGQFFMQPVKNPYNTPLMFGHNSLLAGHISEQNYKRLHNSAMITVHNIGKGRIISFAENPNFRGFWYGTNRLFMNAVMFGQVLKKLRY